MLQKWCNGERNFFKFFEMKDGCKVSCVKINACSIVVKKGTNKLSFYIFDNVAEYWAECSAESAAK